MAIQGSDSIVVHRGGADYRTEASELIAGKGNIQLKQGNTELGRFNVNQGTDQTINIPESEITSINGQTGDVIIDANDLNIEFPVTSVNGMTGDVLVDAGGGDVTSVNGMTGDVIISADDLNIEFPVTSVNGETGDVVIDASDLNIEYPVTSVNGETGDVTVDVPVFSVNGMTGDIILMPDDLGIEYPVTSVNGMTGDVTVDVPIFSVNGQTGDVTIDVPVNSVNGQSGDVLLGLDDLTDVNASGTPSQVLTMLADGSFGLTTVAIPDGISPKGFINVADPAPADPEHGDTYIQANPPSGDSVTANNSFTGIAGNTVDEGTWVVFGTDDEWHAGGNANNTQVQSNWTETDTSGPAFIQNKPTIGDGKYNLSAGTGVHFSGDALFSANQSTDAALQIGIDTVWFGNQVNSNVGDGKYQLTAGSGVLMSGDTLFTANQSIDAGLNIGVDTIWFGNQVNTEINNQINSGKIGNGTYTVSADTGIELGGDVSFSANQSSDAVLNVGIDTVWLGNEISNEVNNAFGNVGDGTYTVSVDAGITASGNVSFSANQSSDAVLNLGVDTIWFTNQVAGEVGNASIQFTGGQGINVTGDTPTANQKTASNTSFAVDVGDGLAFNTSDQLIADLQFIENNISASGGIPEAPTDGNLYVRKGDTESWLRGLPYDISTLPPLS